MAKDGMGSKGGPILLFVQVDVVSKCLLSTNIYTCRLALLSDLVTEASLCSGQVASAEDK